MAVASSTWPVEAALEHDQGKAGSTVEPRPATTRGLACN